jgi:hypothetical protein
MLNEVLARDESTKAFAGTEGTLHARVGRGTVAFGRETEGKCSILCDTRNYCRQSPTDSYYVSVL